MPKQRTIVIAETTGSLKSLLQDHLGEPAERVLRLLLELQEEQTLSLAEAARRINLPYSTAKSWINRYKSKGLQGLIDSLRKSGDSDLLRDIAFMESEVPSSTGLTFEALSWLMMSSPRTADKGDFTTWIKRWIERVLPDVDRVGFSAVSTSLPKIIGCSERIVRYRETLVEDTKTRSVKKVDTEVGSPKVTGHWVELYHIARLNGVVPFHLYHHPTGFDINIFDQGELHNLGSIILLRKKDQPPISERTIRQVSELRIFLSRLITEHSALHLTAQARGLNIRDIEKMVLEGEELTEKEVNTFVLHIHGYSTESIAEIEGVSKRAIEDRTRKVLRKTGTSSIKELTSRIWVRRFDDRNKGEDEPE